MANNKNTNNSTLVLIVAVMVISIGLAIYHHIHNEHVQAAESQRTTLELESCIASATALFKQGESEPLDYGGMQLENEGLAEYKQCQRNTKVYSAGEK